MSEEQTPNVEEIKARLKVDEIPIEEEGLKDNTQKVDVVTELKNLGRQFGETLQTAWNSQERQQVEVEIRDGLRSFANEVDKVIQEAKSSQAAEKVKGGATNVAGKVESAELSRKARSGFVTGLRWLSEELTKVADNFSPSEEPPEDAA